ncbi:hypothetical protein Vadar_017757 [Vaccinium darrowii]|uniref:Uncharacterized protein n=1 Tax=Vaccinium darrowii TaxID=229202 RepID=A0ACB7YMW2_9ERIC|nr:hypothetical protein Vadar_017757 [Vaccinium darrowii]
MSNGGGVGLENFSQQNWGKWSFAEVVKEHRNSTSLSISVNDAAHEWLRRSAIAELPSIWSLEMVRQAIDLNLGPNIQVRELGPSQILLTFDSIAAMDAAFAEGKLICLKEWCGDKIHKWNPNMRLFPSRTVWLSCYGVPIHVWSSDTFSKIGKLWGEIIKLDDDIIKERNFSVGKILVSTSLIKNINQTIEMHCKGESFPVRIIEEQVIMPDFDRAEKFPVNKEETTRETKEEESREDDNSRGDESKIGVDDDPFMVPNSIKSKTDDSCSNCDSLLGDSREDIESFEDNAVARQLENSMEVVEEVAETDDDGANRMSDERNAYMHPLALSLRARLL